MISELGIAIATSIFELALNAFWKRALHIYIYICHLQWSSVEVIAGGGATVRAEVEEARAVDD